MVNQNQTELSITHLHDNPKLPPHGSRATKYIKPKFKWCTALHFLRWKIFRKIRVFTKKRKNTKQLSAFFQLGAREKWTAYLKIKLMLYKNQLYLKRQNVTNKDFIGRRKTDSWSLNHESWRLIWRQNVWKVWISVRTVSVEHFT